MSTITSSKMLVPLILFLQAQYLMAFPKIPGHFLQSSGEDNRIVGGEDIDITQAPYQISLHYMQYFLCGGSLIANDIVITAAHCVYRTDASKFKIRAGSSYFDKGGKVYPVKKVVAHPNYDSTYYDNDIAIILLSQPVTFSDKARAIGMKSSGEEVGDGQMTLVTGWGTTQEGGTPAIILQKVLVPKVSASVCKNSYHPVPITQRMLCAGFPEGGKDSCQGDSGGPLVHNGKLAGVVSFGEGCARPGKPGVYTKISALRQWIDGNIHKLRQENL